MSLFLYPNQLFSYNIIKDTMYIVHREYIKNLSQYIKINFFAIDSIIDYKSFNETIYLFDVCDKVLIKKLQKYNLNR